MIEIEVVSTNEYQDVYRVIPGYLFIVNKFITDKRFLDGRHYEIPRNYYKKLSGKVKEDLCILTRSVKCFGGYCDDGELEYDDPNGEFPIGTVFYKGVPVVKTDNPHLYYCHTRVAWENSNGNIYYWEGIVSEINKIVNSYKT